MTTIHDDYVADLIRVADNMESDTLITITVDTPVGVVHIPCVAADLQEWITGVLE